MPTWTTTTKRTVDLREWRRFRALDLAQKGWKQRAIATALEQYAAYVEAVRAFVDARERAP